MRTKGLLGYFEYPPPPLPPSVMVYEISYSQNSLVSISFVYARFSLIILFGSLQRRSKPICLTGTTFLIIVPSDHGNKIHVFCRLCCLHWLEFWTLFGSSSDFLCHAIFPDKIVWRPTTVHIHDTMNTFEVIFWSISFAQKHDITFNGQAHSVMNLENHWNFFFWERTKRKRIPEPVIVCFRQAERGKKIGSLVFEWIWNCFCKTNTATRIINNYNSKHVALC